MSSASDRPVQVAVVLSGWPRVSEVFALNEVLALRRAGMLAAVFATKRQADGVGQPAAAEIDPLVTYLPDGDVAAQADAVVRALRAVPVAGIHGYFAHRPAAVAEMAAGRLGTRYGFSMHALDARKVSTTELTDRARGAATVICCNTDVAGEVAVTGRVPSLLRHGVDLDGFPLSSAPPAELVTLLAVGRLVEKKGFSVLLEAMARIDRPCRLLVAGEGPCRPELESIVAGEGLAERVTLLGRVTHATLPSLYAGSHLVVVPSVVDSRGDRDGLPNVVLEAMSSGRPVVASDVAALSSAVQDGVTGLLVPPGDPGALGRALTTLIDDPSLRSRMGLAGRLRVERDCDLDACTQAFCDTLAVAYA